MKTIFSKYSTNRRAEKATMTYFTEQDGKTLVRKLPATPAAKEHLEQLAKNYTALQQAVVPQVSVASCWWEGEALVFEKAEGITWLEKLLTVYESGGFEAALAEFKTFRDFLYSCMKTYEPYRFTPEGRETFGVIDLEGKKCMCPANVDLLPANVILDKKGGITIIDYEWVYPFPVPVEYIL